MTQNIILLIGIILVARMIPLIVAQRQTVFGSWLFASGIACIAQKFIF